MPDRTISVASAKGHCVMVDQLPGEEVLPADVTSVDVVGRVATVSFRNHPTCGTFRWSYPRTHWFVLNDKTARARRK